MHTILYMAMSANGIIAMDDYSEDFLMEEDWDLFRELVAEYKNIIWGKNTYLQVKSWSADHFSGEINNALKIIFSRDSLLQLDDGYIQAQTPTEALTILKKQGIKTALLTGGSTINALFAQEHLIDEVFLTLDPVIVGKGIPLFASTNFDFELTYMTCNSLSKERVQLRYRVVR